MFNERHEETHEGKEEMMKYLGALALLTGCQMLPFVAEDTEEALEDFVEVEIEKEKVLERPVSTSLEVRDGPRDH